VKRVLLDTNVCIALLAGRDAKVRARFELLVPGQVFTCAVVKAELLTGAKKSIRPVESLARVAALLSELESLPFDDNAAQAYSDVRAHLEREGTPIGGNDLMIAAIALANGLIVITRNVREFSRVPGLDVDGW